MGLWGTVKKGFETAANIGTAGLYGAAKGATSAVGTNSSAFQDPRLKQNRSLIGSRIKGLTKQDAPTLDTTAGDQFRQGQQTLASALQGQLAGEGPTVAGLQLQKGLEDSLNNQLAFAASQRGGPVGATQRNLARNLMATDQAANMDAAMLRAGEQQQAATTLGSVLSGARGQDLDTASQNAQLDLQQQQTENQLIQQYVQMGLSLDQAAFQARQDAEKLRVQAQMGAKAGQQALIGGVINGIAGLGAKAMGA